MMKFLAAIFLATLLMGFSVVSAQDNQPPFDGCAVDEYYADLFATLGGPANWTLSDLSDLLTNTHRYRLPSTSALTGGDDIFRAITDLYRGVESNDAVLLLYRNVEIPAVPAGTPQSWNAERLFPIMRGAFRNTSAANDVYNLRAADTSVLRSRRGLLFFGECGTVNSGDACISPATGETASDSAQDGKIITPPAVFWGDVARSLFYMQTRYQDSLGLFLSDCPPFEDGEFGYLSPLLEWVIADPVVEADIARNDQACTRWQGNRSAFVDFPELTEQSFGVPDTNREGTFSNMECMDTTDSPTTTPNACSSIQAGDVMTFLQNSDEPDQVVFFPLEDIPDTVGSLFMTDNAWLGEGFSTLEGTVEVSQSSTLTSYCGTGLK
jgi:endonuclease I